MWLKQICSLRHRNPKSHSRNSRSSKTAKQSPIWLSLLITIPVVSGCCSVRPVAFGPQHRGTIKTIGILTIENPPQGYSCYDDAYRARKGSVYQYGAIGSLLNPIFCDALGVPKTEERLSILSAAFEQQQFNFSRELYYSIKEELVKAGYNVKNINIQREDARLFIEDYSKIGGDVDAYLDVVPRLIGCCDEFTSVGGKWGLYYCPWVCIHARLVRPADGEVLYAIFPVHGFKPDCGYAKIDRDNQYTWKSFEELIDDFPRFREGIQQAIKKISQKIATDLK